MLRDRLSMQIFQRLGLPAPRVNSARVFMNGDYIGLYENFESVDEVYVNRWFNESTGYLSQFSPFTSGPFASGFHFEYLGDDLDNYAPVPFQPQNHQNAPDTVSLQGMFQVVNFEPDATFASKVAAYLDLKRVAHYNATEDFMGEWDGFLGDIFGMNNFSIYRFHDNAVFELLCTDEKDTFTSPTRELFHNASINVLTRRELTLPDVRNTWLEALMKIYTIMGGPNGWLEQEIAREYAQIKQAVYDDPYKLIDNGGVFTVMTNADFENQISGLPVWVRQRRDFVAQAASAAGFTVSGAGPRLSAGGIVNAASNTGAVLAPGSLVTAYGSQFSTTVAQTPSVNLPATLAGLTIYVNGLLAPLVYVSPGQVNFQIPWEAGAGPATVTMIGNGPLGTLGNTVTVNIGTFSPGIFAVVHGDGSYVSGSSPAAANEVLILWATGLGPVSPAGVTGAPPSGAPSTTANATVTVGGAAGVVQFSGMSSYAGLYQVNVQLPANLASGSAVPLVLTIGGQSVTVPIATR